MRKAFTLIELFVVLVILAIIASMIVGVVRAIITTNQRMEAERSLYPKVGQYGLWNGKKVYVVTWDVRTSPQTMLIRLENNTEVHVVREELSVLPEATK